MKIGGFDFPDRFLNALSDGNLVIFAGAGISMGKPANMPSFAGLARQISEQSGIVIADGEGEARFLGRLQDGEVKVHELAAQLLTKDLPKPTELHCNLLGLYPEAAPVRVVTTNFDLLFEQAANDLPYPELEIFRAPALPLGQRFQGIVQIHGSVTNPAEMVLTDKDFGRAYLTENDGWARRFLLALFSNFTILFVGYSHNDTIMTYLARALPAEGVGKRYALIGSLEESVPNWRGLGVDPIIFHQSDKDDFESLGEAVRSLAEYRKRGNLEWRARITQISRQPPPLVSGEESDIVEYALQDVVTTRFFTDSAVLPEWVDWLDEHKHLDALFDHGLLAERDNWLAFWLAKQFLYEAPYTLFSLIGRHHTRLNPGFWTQLVMQINNSDPPNAEALSRWASLILNTAPVSEVRPTDRDNILPYNLTVMAEKCSKEGLLSAVLQIYGTLVKSLLDVDPSNHRWTAFPMVGDHYTLTTLWEKCFKPNLALVAESLLRQTTFHLEKQHSMSCVWLGDSRDRSTPSWFRAAIEPHQKDSHPYDIDALIDIARDCLEWLGIDRRDVAQLWANQQANSDAPLLRRLAVHAVTVLPDLTADAKIDWLLQHTDIHETPTRHEVFKVVKDAYPCTSQEQREALIKTISDYRSSLNEEPDGEQYRAYRQLEWFHWLHSADPVCTVAKQALDDVWEQYPDWRPSEHPDLSVWVGEIVQAQSPWDARELLAKPASEWLRELIAYEPTDPLHGREEMVRAVTEAAKQNPAWGIDLADELAGTAQWDSDLWNGITNAWAAGEFSQEDLARLLNHLSSANLYMKYSWQASYILSEIAKNESNLQSPDMRSKANSLATELWEHIKDSDASRFDERDDWLMRAINHEAGHLALFWVLSISIWRKAQEPAPQALDDDYRTALSTIMQNDKLAGKLGRCFLASQLPFLLDVDEHWTRENLLPLFDTGNPDFQSAWDGLLGRGGVRNRSVAELMREVSIKAIQCIEGDLSGGGGFNRRQEQFVENYTLMLCEFAEGANDKWITELFKYGSDKVKELFATKVWRELSAMNEAQQRDWWVRWLKDYWETRLLNIPAPLSNVETERMIDWTTCLSELFPEAVELAVRTPISSLKRGMILRTIKESGLPGCYPEQVAKLLIHIGRAESNPGAWYGMRETIEVLIEARLPADLEKGLRELSAKHHL